MKRKTIAFCTTLAFVLAFLVPSLPAQAATPADSTASVDIIVEVDGAPVLAHKKAQQLGAQDYIGTRAAKNDEQQLRDRQAKVLRAINDLNGTAPAASKGQKTARAAEQPLTSNYSYTHVYNGFALTVPAALLDDIAALPGVKSVHRVHRYPAIEPPVSGAGSLQTDRCCSSIGVDTLHQQGIRGEGRVVAVIDTELAIDHEFFAGEVTNPALSKASVAQLIQSGQLNIFADENINNVYRSSKMPFVYNYYDQGPDVFNANPQGIHGSHVAGIACGRNGTLENGQRFDGIAPEAQLVFMAAASYDNFYFGDDAIMAAIDDATKLGADVINMSFGSDYLDPTDPQIAAMNTAREAGVFLAAASSNASRTAASAKESGICPDQIDYSSMGEPASIEATTSVASNDTYSDSKPMSSFSGWGPSTDLSLKPEITAPGGDIYSAVPTENYASNHYQRMGGCSMATPHIAGCTALLNEYIQVHQGDYMTAHQHMALPDLVENLMMSTATILYDPDHPSVPYATRHQGAGQINLEKAIQTPVVLTGATGKGKICLYDDIDTNKNQYTLEFSAFNFGNQDVTYDHLDVLAITDDTNSEGYIEGMRALGIDALSMPDSITIPAGQTVPVRIDVTLDSADVQKNLRVFKNGFFVDGFVTLASSQNDVPDISIPYSGFYGDWNRSPALDQPIYNEDNVADQTYLYTTTPLDPEYKNILGSNYHFSQYITDATDNGFSREAHCGISPNGDGFADDVLLNLYPLRNTLLDEITITDEGGTVIYTEPLGDNETAAKFTV